MEQPKNRSAAIVTIVVAIVAFCVIAYFATTFSNKSISDRLAELDDSGNRFSITNVTPIQKTLISIGDSFTVSWKQNDEPKPSYVAIRSYTDNTTVGNPIIIQRSITTTKTGGSAGWRVPALDKSKTYRFEIYTDNGTMVGRSSEFNLVDSRSAAVAISGINSIKIDPLKIFRFGSPIVLRISSSTKSGSGYYYSDKEVKRIFAGVTLKSIAGPETAIIGFTGVIDSSGHLSISSTTVSLTKSANGGSAYFGGSDSGYRISLISVDQKIGSVTLMVTPSKQTVSTQR